jgi:REP element-mobilizing transposase RayT
MSDGDRPVRRRLFHDVPHWVEDGALFFITVNCTERGRLQLTQPPVATGLLDVARFYHDSGRWHLELFVLMPDHLHAIVGFPRGVAMTDVFKAWKRYAAQQFGIEWQVGFFDHRLRNDAEVTEKHDYIRQNPVRKRLCQRPEEWPHQLRWTSKGLVAGGGG